MKIHTLLATLFLSLAVGSAFAQRDPLKWPFSKYSIWNMPIHNDAVYVPAGIQDAVNFEVDEDIIIMTPDAPMMNVETNYTGWGAGGDARCAAQGPTLFSAPIPREFIFSNDVWHGSTPNSGVAVLLPNGKIKQSQPFAKCSEDVATSLYQWNENECELTGECITGAHGGSHLSAIGGAVRVGEFTAGEIRHVLKVNLFGKENFYNGDGGFRWPAVRADGGYNDPDASNYYGGTNPEMRIGALLALHKDVVLESVENNSLGLETEGALIVARAMQNYGAYTVDNTAWDTYGLITEIGPDGRVSDEFKALYGYDMNYYGNPDSPWARDIKRLFLSLYVISNNGPETIGGGPKNDLTNRRAPAAPDFQAAEALKIMPLGDSKTEGGGGNGQQSSWRGFLRANLINAGYQIDFVGPRQNYADGDVLPYDYDHAGFGGYTIGPDINRFCGTCETTGLYEHIQNYLPNADPDIVLLAIGVNDMFNPSVHPPDYAATAPERYRALVQKIQELKPGVRIIVSTIEPVRWDRNWGGDPDDQNLGSLNAAIRALADSSSTDNIFFADVRNRFLETYSTADFFDDVHLSAQGASKNAQTWFDALVPVIQGIPDNAAPSVTITSPAPGLELDAPATITIEADAVDVDGTITNVAFLNGNTLLGEVTTPPYTFTWSDVGEGTYTLKAVATDDFFKSSTSEGVTVTVASTDGYIKFPGTGIGSPGAYGGSDLTFDKALDGDMSTYFDAPVADGQWVGLDLGVARIVKKVRFVPREGWEQRMVNGTIEASHAADFTDAVTLYTIASEPGQGVFTVGRFENDAMYRYYRYLAPNNGYGNVAEIEFWGDPNDPVNEPPVCTLTAPSGSETYAPGAEILLSATASDADGSIARVDFFANNVLIGSAAESPYTFRWTDAPIGASSIRARAVDDAGVSTYSASVQLTVLETGLSVLYEEDFNLNTAEGWVANGGTWVASGQKYRSTATNGAYTAFYSGAAFSNYTYSVDAVADWNNDIGFVFNYQDVNNYYLLVINTNARTASLRKRQNGSVTTLATDTFTGNGTGSTHHVQIANANGVTTVDINNATIFEAIPTNEFSSGKIGLYSFYCPSAFDNIVVTSNNVAPEVTLTAPEDGAEFFAPATIEISASATDVDGSIDRVEFFNHNTLLATDSVAPYSFSWAGAPEGDHYLTARAIDNDGAQITSSVVLVKVIAPSLSVAFDNPPMELVAGQTYSVNISYSSPEPAIVDLYLYDGNWNRITSVHGPVASGAGTKTLQVAVPQQSGPTSNAIWAVNLWKQDWSSVLKSSVRNGVNIVQTGTSNNGGSVLAFTSLCSDDPAQRRWRVRNLSAEPVTFTWEVYKSTQAGEGVVQGNEDYVFYTEAVNGANTTIVRYGEGQSITKASSNADCGGQFGGSGEVEPSVTAYPVPASTEVRVSLRGFRQAMVSIMDATGRVLYRELATDTAFTLPISYPSGLYVLSVTDGVVTKSTRLLVE